jgi:hypothetical protein
MRDYLRIARAYLHGTAVAVWCFMLLCLLTFSAMEGEFARDQGGIPDGVLSRKSHMAMFAYFNACVFGVLLRDSIAHPWASVLPNYLKKHLLVAALIVLFFLGIPMFAMEFVGTRDIAPTGVAVIFLTCLAAGLWTPQHPLLGVLAVLFLVFARVPSASAPERAAFPAGTIPAISAVLVFLSLVALWAFARRLLALNEDMMEYATARVWGNLLRGRGQIIRGQAKIFNDDFAALPADQRDILQNCDRDENRFTNLNQIDSLSGNGERSLWQRLQLWRLGTAPTRTSVSLGMQIVLLLIMIPPFVFIPPLLGAENPARNIVVNFSVMVMTNPFNTWLFWIKRLHRLGYESLRPRTRQEFIRELSLALLWDIFQCWLGGVLFMGIAAVLWAPELLQTKNLFLFILGTGVGQLCAFAIYAMLGTWLLKRGMVDSVLCAFCPFLAIAIWMLFIAQPIGVELNIAIASVLTPASLAIIALAYRRWCRMDLD